MKYSSTILDDFEFHDAILTLVSFTEDCMTVSVKGLNIHAAAEQNDQPVDMEIHLARMTFRDFHVAAFEPGRAWRRNSKGELYTNDPLVIYEGKAAERQLLAELREQVCVYSFKSADSGLFRMDACGIEPWFTTQVSFSSVLIEWDEYLRPAWYEK